MRLVVSGKASGSGGTDANADGHLHAFIDRYTAAYRAAYRLLGDADRATGIAREAVAATDAAVVPRSERVRLVRACRTATLIALRETKDKDQAADAPAADERAQLRAVVRSLPAQPRTVFLLVRVAGLHENDVGAALGLTPDWCGSQLRVAERTVREVFGALPVTRPPAPADPDAPPAPDGPSRGRRGMLLAARGER